MVASEGGWASRDGLFLFIAYWLFDCLNES